VDSANIISFRQLHSARGTWQHRIGDHDLWNLQLIIRSKSSSDKNKLLRAGGNDCDAIGEKERNPNPIRLVFINFLCEKRRRSATRRMDRVPTMNYYCRTLLKAQKQDLLFQLESRFNYYADS
jgi:hypothetical protein